MKSRETQISPSKPPELQKGLIRQLRQASRLELNPETDYRIEIFTNRYTDQKSEVVILTESGEKKREKIKNDLFGELNVIHKIPLGKIQIESMKSMVVEFDGLLALATIRARTGGYVCSFTDDFNRLRQEKYLARVMSVNQDSIRIMFDHWPGEYINRAYVLERGNLVSINEPISIGPECVIDPQILRDGHPHEPFFDWFKNLIQRNLRPRT